MEIDTSKALDMERFRSGNKSFNGVLTLDLTSSSNEYFLYEDLHSVIGVRIINMGLSCTHFQFANSSLTADAVMLLCQDLPDRSLEETEGTLVISRNPAVNQLTENQIAEFTAKNWTLVL